MKISLLCFSLLFASVFVATGRSYDETEKISAEDVPANVKNSFNRIYIDHDPKVWYVAVVKPKGEKKSRRYIAEYENKGRSHLVRFDEHGMPVGEYYVLNEKMSNHVSRQLSTDYPEYTVEKVESLWMFRESLSVFKVLLLKKSKPEVIFVDDNGIQIFDESLVNEFAQG